MKIAAWIARILLGLLFVVFGIDHWLHFIPIPPFEEGPAKQFFTVFATTHYLDLVKGCEVLGGLLVLTGRFTPLGLAILIPVTVNILAFTTLVAPMLNPPGMVALLLEVFLIYAHWDRVKGVFIPSPVK